LRGLKKNNQQTRFELFNYVGRGRNVEKSTGILAVVMNVLWILIFGVQICLAHLFFALILAMTIVGIPFAKQHMKLCAVALSPFGKEIVNDK